MNQQPNKTLSTVTMPRATQCWRLALSVSVLTSSLLVAGCAPLILGGAMVGTAFSVSDRRSSGAQVEDQAIEFKSISRLNQALGGRGHVSVTSYNRNILLTGEVATEADLQAAKAAVAAIENVGGVVNELAVMANSTLGSRSNDAVLTSKVKASHIDARDVQGNVFKVVTERGVVYLMGIVTEREAARAADIARGVNGVKKVVRVFEVVSDAELARLQPVPAKK